MRYAEVEIDGKRLSEQQVRTLLQALETYAILLQGNFTDATVDIFSGLKVWLKSKQINTAKELIQKATSHYDEAGKLIAEAQKVLFGNESRCLGLATNVTRRSALEAEILRKTICREPLDEQHIRRLRQTKQPGSPENRIIGPE